MIDVQNLVKYFGSKCVLDDLSLQISAGTVLVLLGTSGCGKTTFLRLLAGFEKPDQGEISKNGQLISCRNFCLEPAKRGLAMIFQDLALWPHMTIFQNVAFAAKKMVLSSAGRSELVFEILEKVSLAKYARSYPNDLSGGERQRLAIARAVVTSPEILLMDEPFNNLDPVTKIDMLNLIRAMSSDRPLTIVYSTHNFDEILGFADRVAILDEGRIEAELGKRDFVHFSQADIYEWYKSCVVD